MLPSEVPERLLLGVAIHLSERQTGCQLLEAQGPVGGSHLLAHTEWATDKQNITQKAKSISFPNKYE